MRNRSLILSLALLSFSARAVLAGEPPAGNASAPGLPPAAAQGSPRGPHRLAVVGKATAIVGAGLTVIGISLFSIAYTGREHDGWSFDTMLAGASLIGIGQGSTLVGVPLWAVGEARARSLQLSLGASGMSVQF